MVVSYAIRESGRGGWECLEDGRVLDQHAALGDALEHLRSVAGARGRALDVGEQVRITSIQAPGYTLVAVRGELDLYTTPLLRKAISGGIHAGVYDVVVDLTRVEFLDSTGLGFLVAALKNIQANGGSLQLVFTQAWLVKLFSITGLRKVFVIRDSVETAFANLTIGAQTGQPPLADHDPVVPAT